MLAAPLAVTLFIQQINGFVDTFWVSGISSDAVASIGVISPIYVTVIGIGSGLGIGVTASISRYIGKKDRISANRIASQGLVLTVLISVVLTAILIITAESTLRLIGAETILPICMEYAVPLYIGTIFIMLCNVMSGMLRGEGAAKRSMYVQVIGAIINIFLDPIFIFKLNMGIAGAAWATVISVAVSSAIPFYWYLIDKSTFVSIKSAYFKNGSDARSDILVVGFPAIVELSEMSLFNILLLYFIIICGGTNAVAVYTTAWKVLLIGLVPAQAISGALVPVCSAKYGMKKFDAVYDAFRYSVLISVIVMIIIFITIIVFAEQLSWLFTNSGSSITLHDELKEALVILSITLPAFSLVYSGSSLMQSLKKAGQAMINTFIRNVMIVILFAIAVYTLMGPNVLWISIVIGEIVGGIMMYVHANIVLKNIIKKEVKPTDNLRYQIH